MFIHHKNAHQSLSFGRKAVLVAALVSALGFTGLPTKVSAAATPESFAEQAERLLPSVVNISSTQKVDPDMQMMPDMPQFPEGSPFQEFFDEFMEQNGNGMMPPLPQASLGSGFIIDAAKGLIVTNNHVIRDADKVRVTLHDDTTLDAKILGVDDKTDLAVLQVKPNAAMRAVTFGDSDKMRVGDWVLAIGNPFGLGGTVTSGIISARKRDINAGPYDDFIQTDASINRGNSGGPMFNLKGDVIGINTAIFSPSGGSVGIGFAIPSNLAKPVIDQLVKYGKTRRGWIGVRIQSVTDEIAQTLGLPKMEGALVASVAIKGPAAEAGLRSGDIILEFGGQKITAMRNLPRLVAESEIGATVPVKFWREGKLLNTSLKVEEMVDEAPPETTGKLGKTDIPGKVPGLSIPELKLQLGMLTEMDRRNFGIPENAKGVLILDVAANSEAAEKGIQAGDVIVEINQQRLTEPTEVKELIARSRKEGNSNILILLDMGGKGDVRFVTLKIKE